MCSSLTRPWHRSSTARGTSPTSSQGQRGPVSWCVKLLLPADTEIPSFHALLRYGRARHAMRKKPEEYDPLAGGLLPGSRPAPSLSVSAFDYGGEEDAAASAAPTLSRPSHAFRESRSFSRKGGFSHSSCFIATRNDSEFGRFILWPYGGTIKYWTCPSTPSRPKGLLPLICAPELYPSYVKWSEYVRRSTFSCCTMREISSLALSRTYEKETKLVRPILGLGLGPVERARALPSSPRSPFSFRPTIRWLSVGWGSAARGARIRSYFWYRQQLTLFPMSPS